MKTVQIKFDHENSNLYDACGLHESIDFILDTLETNFKKLKEDEQYTYSHALEDTIIETRKHFGMDTDSINIWSDDTLMVLIAFRLGEIIGTHNTMKSEAGKMMGTVQDVFSLLNKDRTKEK